MPDDTPVMDVLSVMTAASLERTTLDPAAVVLVRFAALVAMDAAPASYLFHLGAGSDVGLTMQDAQQVLVTLAPLVGSARIVAATGKIARGIGLAVDMSDLGPADTD